MKKLLSSIVLLFTLIATAMGQTGTFKSKSVLSSEIGTCFPNQLSGAITPPSTQACMQDFMASWQQAPGINNQGGTTYTIQASDYGQLVVFNNSNPVAVTLPTPSSWPTNIFNFYALNTGTGTVTITPNNGVLIAGGSNFSLAQNNGVEIRSDGTQYQVLKGTGSLPTGLNGQVLLGVTSSAPQFGTMSQDCTITNTGVITCTKTNNVAFGPLATQATPCNVNQGCTGATSFNTNGVVIGNNPFTSTVAGTSGQLFLGVTSGAPQWGTMSQDCTITNAGVITCTKTNNVAFGPLATQAVPCTIAQGCTSQTTAAAARGASGLNIDECTSTGDANYSILTTDRCVYHTALTAARTDTLPTAASVNAGQTFYASDLQGKASGTNTITLARNSTDTINGGTSFTAVNAAFGLAICISDGVSRWECQTIAGGAGGGVSSVTIAAGTATAVSGTCTITTSGTCTVDLSTARKTLPTHQVFTSGTNLTYTTPANVLWIEITMVGGGGSGSGGGSSPGTGNSGTATCWNTSGTACTSPVYQAGGGNGCAVANPQNACTGGTIGGSGTCDWSVPGGSGSAGTFAITGSVGAPGGKGGDSSLGGGGGGAYANGTASAGATNSGSGGGAGGATAVAANESGVGGGAGATCHVVINTPAASYTYTVGTGGTAGTAGTNGGAGGAGAAGQIIVYEHYGT